MKWLKTFVYSSAGRSGRKLTDVSSIALDRRYPTDFAVLFLDSLNSCHVYARINTDGEVLAAAKIATYNYYGILNSPFKNLVAYSSPNIYGAYLG